MSQLLRDGGNHNQCSDLFHHISNQWLSCSQQNWKGAVSAKTVLVPSTTEPAIKTEGDQWSGEKQPHECMFEVGGWWHSLPVGELIQRICSASWDGERTLIGAEFLHRDPGTGRTLSVLPTTECISMSTQISPSITNSASFSDWSWQMLPTDPVNVSRKGPDSLSPLL